MRSKRRRTMTRRWKKSFRNSTAISSVFGFDLSSGPGAKEFFWNGRFDRAEYLSARPFFLL
ncbi:hypothetical protein RB3393 [Rhodopirellula baltica SH 1]|uniref:Uncharacterized protein n=1 Tax=Rhodopirellula baltica (strain DSM 10527 / NCIMB 13988 / SH1) TaxID=243090 RepID=Q7UUB6_RHOBA|nr:hypothetical protein RB3393 [Rhodopirellula baltica SH 1]